MMKKDKTQMQFHSESDHKKIDFALLESETQLLELSRRIAELHPIADSIKRKLNFAIEVRSAEYDALSVILSKLKAINSIKLRPIS